MLPPIAAFARHYGGKLRRISRRAQDELGEANAVLRRRSRASAWSRRSGARSSSRPVRRLDRAHVRDLAERVRARAAFVPVVTMLGFTSVVGAVVRRQSDHQGRADYRRAPTC
ncbi:MAG: hypothetical protein WKH64_05125 [Chloroflexia bacterium]